MLRQQINNVPSLRRILLAWLWVRLAGDGSWRRYTWASHVDLVKFLSLEWRLYANTMKKACVIGTDTSHSQL